MRTRFIIGNWKMHKNGAEVAAYFAAFSDLAQNFAQDTEIGICPQSIHLGLAVDKTKNTPIQVLAQNSGQAASGAFTGENSPASLRELGVKWVLLGHSERRWVFSENNTLIQGRLQAALDAGLNVVLCIGERLVERKEGRTFLVLEEQLGILVPAMAPLLHRVVVAYEPVWAIGTGETATPAQAQEAHAFIRQWFHDKFSEKVAAAMRVLYGGSVKADNSAALLSQPDVDGLLVGGASLDPLGFAELVRNGVRSTP